MGRMKELLIYMSRENYNSFLKQYENEKKEYKKLLDNKIITVENYLGLLNAVDFKKKELDKIFFSIKNEWFAEKINEVLVNDELKYFEHNRKKY